MIFDQSYSIVVTHLTVVPIFPITQDIFNIHLTSFFYFLYFIGTELQKEEDKVRLHLFEREAVENYLYETQQEMSNGLNYQVSSTSDR